MICGLIQRCIGDCGDAEDIPKKDYWTGHATAVKEIQPLLRISRIAAKTSRAAVRPPEKMISDLSLRIIYETNIVLRP